MSPVAANPKTTTVPLCVDLDGTLIRSDVLWESLVLLVKHNPLFLFALPFWLLRGRAYMKQQIAARTELDAADLPYHLPFLEFLKSEHGNGRKLVLATAADVRLAQNVAGHVGLFSDVIASDGATNMRGKNKGNTLSQRFGEKGFDYAGNSTVDLPVWQQAREAIVVNANDHLAERAGKIATVGRVFNEPDSLLRLLLKAIRPHQWVKNVIVFVPLLTSHNLGNSQMVFKTVLAFIAFSFCASGVYVLNDLLDLASDRHHPTKRNRAFASGRLALPVGFFLAPLLLASSVVVSWFTSERFILVLGAYFLLTTSYSWRVKKIPLLDVFFLAGLYTMRLIGGHAAAHIPNSFWLLAFSMFIFLSLALVKRFTELHGLRRDNRHDSKGRGYTSADLELVAMLGIASGFMAVLVMALYVNSEEFNKLYTHKVVLLMMCPLLLYWISRVWLLAHRGYMHDDPIVFALKDRVSYVVGALCLAVVWLATGNHLGFF